MVYDDNPQITNDNLDNLETIIGNQVETPLRRWNKKNPEGSIRAINKKKRNLGLEYTVGNKKFPEKCPKPILCDKCKFDCLSFTEGERNEICRNYWGLVDFQRKKDFIISRLLISEPNRRRLRQLNAKCRTESRKYFFLENGVETRVCQSFFLKTLNISNSVVISALKTVIQLVHLFLVDKRGGHNKGVSIEKDRIKKHIETFPTTESHYVRKKSKRHYLDSRLSIAKMHELYKELWLEKYYDPQTPQIKPPSLTTYKRVFCQEYNLSFYKPKKDQCSLCAKYNDANENEKENLKLIYESHKEREKSANLDKSNDKEKLY